MLLLLNVGLVLLVFYLFTRKGMLTYFKGGRLWLTWLSVGVITLMDEFTSIFYAPSEALRFMGLGAIIFIPLTAILIRFLTTRMVEIAEILHIHGMKGGGVYNFSYFVLGPVVSFVAVASIMVTYILTAAISSVSAVENAGSFLSLTHDTKLFLMLGVIWLIAGLNILGIRENARVTFSIFLGTAIVFINFIVSGFLELNAGNIGVIQQAATQSFNHLTSGQFFHAPFYLVMAFSSCILAYSGVESVLQTGGLVEDWKVISRAYVFLALSVGVVTPLISVLALSQTNIDFSAHRTDLMTHYAVLLRGQAFGVTVGVLASIALMLAINTAFVASGELIERVCKRYNFAWPVKSNRFFSLHRIHIANALFYSFIVLFTRGNQGALAEMYAIGLVATFLINLLSLLIYRYFKGTKEIPTYNVGRLGTLLLFLILLSCFIYLSYHKPHGFILWLTAVCVCLIAGIYGTKKRMPEIKVLEKGEGPMDIILYIGESAEHNVHIYFKRPLDAKQDKLYGLSLYITFYSPRDGLPPKMGPNHFRIPFKRASIQDNISAVLSLLLYEIPDRNITVHFGWPTSSWLDRLSTGVMVFQFIRFPKQFPGINFRIEQFGTVGKEKV